MFRRRIGILEDITVPEAAKFHKSPLILCKTKSDIKKYGRASVRSIEDDLGVFRLPRLSAKVVYGSDHDKIVDYLKEAVYGFAVVVLSKELSANHKKLVDAMLPVGRIKVVVQSKKASVMDVGDGRWLKVHNDLDAPLYESTAPKLKVKSSSSPAPKVKKEPKAKVKAVKSAAPNPPKDSKKSD